MKNDILVLIPARSGSKGIKDKNIEKIKGKTLLNITVEFAMTLFKPENICVSTDSKKYKKLVESGTCLSIPFLRPNRISTDTSTNRDYILHALNYYKSKNRHFNWVLILQCTSPIRNKSDIRKAIKLTNYDYDMIASVHITDSNPFYVQRRINSEGLLEPLFNERFTRRQDCPEIYELNGNFFLVNVNSIKKKNMNQFDKVFPLVIDKLNSFDIDDKIDLEIVKSLYKN
tara:strand:- start:4304 stop:4990 length:687 start_codon:yes stop_codon:yes gene_type:complete